VLAMLDIEESMLDVAYDTEDVEEVDRRAARAVGGTCEDLTLERPEVAPLTPGECEECVRDGTRWVHLRLCLDCGHVGCCDSSPQRHASAHFRDEGHRVMQSHEPGESWRWCFVHHLTG